MKLMKRGVYVLTVKEKDGNHDKGSLLNCDSVTLPPIDHFSLPFGTYSCIHLIALLHRHLELHFHVKILSSSDHRKHGK